MDYLVGEVFHKGRNFKVMNFRNMEILLPTKIWLMFLITFDLQELQSSLEPLSTKKLETLETG